MYISTVALTLYQYHIAAMEQICVTRKNNYVHGPTFNEELGRDGFGCFLYENFLENGEKIFQVDGITGKTETYGSVLKRSVRVALEMRSRGITENDVVVICCGNSMDSFIPIFATALLNAAVASLDPSQSVRDVVYLLNTIEPKMIFVQDSALDLIATSKKEFLFTPQIVVMGNETGASSFRSFLKCHPEETCFKPKPVKDCKNTAMVFFSSGTTGMPKGICIPAYSILTSVLATGKYDVTGTVGFHGSSFYWISAMLVTIAVILNKGRKVILSNFDLETLFKAIQCHKIDYALLATNFAYTFNNNNISQYDLSSLRFLGFIGCVLSSGDIQRCRQLLPNTAIVSGYGLTEAGGFALLFPTNRYDEAKKYPSSCGMPLPGMTIKVVDTESEEVLGPNQQGELRFKCKYYFTEYFKKDSSDAFDCEGFVKTGDVGYYDGHNYFYIKDRIKDMFKYKSWHIVPASVEAVILQHPAVKEAVVVGIPHSTDGDLPMAIVVLKNNFQRPDENELISFVNDRVLDREKLRGGLKIVENLSKTPSGKIPRAMIRKAAIESSL